MSNPIAKVSLYRFDGELRGTVLRTYEGASLLLLGDHDVYAAPVTAANQPEPVNQQILAALKEFVEFLDGGCNACTVSCNPDRYPCHSCNRAERKASEDLRRPYEFFTKAQAAIAAAEAAQPTGWCEACKVETGTVRPCDVCGKQTQPASAQPVAVPDAEIIQCFETEMARNPAAYDQPGEVVYQITQKELVRAARAMLSAAKKPEGEE